MTSSLSDLNAMSRQDFVAKLGAIFEHSPWIAEAVADDRPFSTVAALHNAMVGTVEKSGDEAQLKLIRAHPDLAGKAALAGVLTEESTAEQKGAGLDRLTAKEFARFHELNDAYKARFEFPFILAVRGHDKRSILAAFEKRLQNNAETETTEALAQIARIGLLRLNDLVEG
jgi:2-oxo-4-hydroxy-4-carboxy-5-ureidoimidazoline decarboxylase